MYSDKFPEMPDSTSSQWDARQLFTRKLQELEETANVIKIKIELREGTTNEVIGYFKIYFSLLRAYYRELRPFFNHKEQEKLDSIIDIIKNELIKFSSQSYGKILPMKNISIPRDLEYNLEELHNVLNQRRFEKKLVVPIYDPERDETGIKGWEDA